MSEKALTAVMYKYRLDLTVSFPPWWVSDGVSAVVNHAAWSSFFFTTGSVSMKVCIGVLP